MLADRLQLDVACAGETRAQVFLHDIVYLRHRLGGAVITLHQLLAGEAVRAIGEAELFRQRGLQVEDQPIFAASRQIVQAHAHRVQEAFVALYVA